MARRSFNSLMGADPADDRQHRFETSWLLSPFVLFAVRALLSLFAFFTIFFDFGWNGSHNAGIENRRSFSYFTNLSYWGVAFYFLVAAVHTYLYSRTGRSVLLVKWPRWLRALHSLLYSTIVVFPMIVTIVFWALLYDGPWWPDSFDSYKNIATHMLQAVFALFEIIFPTTTPLPFLHLPFLVLMAGLYLCVAYITHADQGFYTYDFLDPGADGEHSGRVAGYCFGILAIVLVIFFVDWGLIWLRRRFTGDAKTKFARKDRGGATNGDVESGPQEK